MKDACITYIPLDERYNKNKGLENQINSYYSNIKDILTAIVTHAHPTMKEDLTQKLAIIQTKGIFSISGFITDPNYTINEKGKPI